MNCDLVVTNESSDRLRISELELSVFDSTGRLVLRKTVNSNGFRPSITAVAPQMLEPKSTIDIFNPFCSFDAAVPLFRLQFTVRYQLPSDSDGYRLPFDFDGEGRVNVSLHAHVQKTPLNLPLRGRLLVWDGRDFFSHHRRIPLHDARVEQADRGNSDRFAVDLILVDSGGSTVYGNALPQGELAHLRLAHLRAGGRACDRLGE